MIVLRMNEIMGVHVDSVIQKERTCHGRIRTV